MLVHICCSVDSHYFLSQLKEVYPDERFVGFFYNPNIHPKSEYDLRLADVKRSCQMLNIELLEGAYDLQTWFDGVKGLEDEPEKGERCIKCFDIRLIQTALQSKKLNEKRFTTTLLSSPMKEQQRLFTEGDDIAKRYDLEFIKINVRSNGGVQKQNALAKKDNLYRQNYCGCKFALTQQRNHQGKTMLEMMSDVMGKKLLGSIEERQETFCKRDMLEQNNQPYLLLQRKYQVYRNLKCYVRNDKGELFGSYAIFNSQSKKKTKIGEILWAKPKLILQEQKLEAYKNNALQIGFSKKDDSVFVPLDFVNFIFDKNYSNLIDFRHNPLEIEEELKLRKILCGIQSLNAIIIMEQKIQDFVSVELESLFQEENIFRVVELL